METIADSHVAFRFLLTISPNCSKRTLARVVMRVKGTKLRGSYNNLGEFLWLRVLSERTKDLIHYEFHCVIVSALSPPLASLESRDYRHADDREVVCFSITL